MKLSEHFSREEFACNDGCGLDTVDAELINVLEFVRRHFGGRPVIITSGYRCPEHNAAVSGAPDSQHLHGRAADIVIQGIPARDVAAFLDDNFPDRLGIGSYARFTHVDTRTVAPARWDERRST